MTKMRKPHRETLTLIPPEYDRRIKLTPEQRLEIAELYKTGKWSQRQLARYYSVSRRLVVFCIHPDRKLKAAERFKERQKERIYYHREKHRVYMQNHRRYKKMLDEKGKLIEKETTT